MTTPQLNEEGSGPTPNGNNNAPKQEESSIAPAPPTSAVPAQPPAADNNGTPNIPPPTPPRPPPSATKTTTTTATPKDSKNDDVPVDLMLGEFIAQGGFCSIHEVTGIKNLSNGKWILEPPPESSGSHNKKGGHKRGGSGAFGSLGAHLALGGISSPQRKGKAGHHHKRGASMPANYDDISALPPLMKSVQLTVVKPFISPSDLMKTSNNNNSNNSLTSSLPPGAAGSAPTLNTVTPPSRNSGGGRISKRNSFTIRPRTKSPKSSAAPFRRSKTSDGAFKAAAATATATIGGGDLDQQYSCPYVLKCLKPAVFGSHKVLDMGLKDMKIEIEILQRLTHPNIVSILAHGMMILDAIPVVHDKTTTTSSPTDTPYPFVILDRLGETLENKLDYWENKHNKNSSLMGKFVTHRNYKKINYAAHERWSVLRDISSALEYMHEQRIVYRDLKPENVAFDRYSDTLKLIDLGLAKDLKPLTPTKKHKLYRLTALTGSARYMAPEVAREEQYNELCDVYGMAIVIWQVISLQTPYAKFNVQKMFQVVYDCPHVRPSLEQWKEEEDDDRTSSYRWLTHLLNKMWNPLIEERPTMKEVHKILKRQVEKVAEQQQQTAAATPSS